MSNLRWAVPASVMLGSAPTYWGIWGGWRTVTIILPRRVYEIGDDFLYSLYQKLVLFFFENLSGVEVSHRTIYTLKGHHILSKLI